MIFLIVPMSIFKSMRPSRGGLIVYLVAVFFSCDAWAVDALKPTAGGDVGLAQGLVSFAHQLDLLGTDNGPVESHDPNARTFDLARVATMRRVLLGAATRLHKIAEQRDLDLSPAFRNGLKNVVTKLRVVTGSKQFYDPAALGRAITGIATEIEGRFGSAGPMEKPTGLMARLRKPKAEAVAAHDAPLLEMGRVFEFSALELTLMTIAGEEPLKEIRYFLKDSGMEEAAGLIGKPETFWSGVDESLGEIAHVIQNTAAEIRPLVAGETLPPAYVTGMNQVWRILKTEQAKPQNQAADATWFPAREKLRNFGRPARCERLLTVMNANGSSEMVIEDQRTHGKPAAAEAAEPGAEAGHELMMPL